MLEKRLTTIFNPVVRAPSQAEAEKILENQQASKGFDRDLS